MVAKGFVTVGFSSIYVYTSELFPTEVRNVGVGSASMCARVGGMIAPYMGPSLVSSPHRLIDRQFWHYRMQYNGLLSIQEQVWKPLPSVVTGVLAFIAGALTLFLPETLDQPLFNTIEEAEAFGK